MNYTSVSVDTNSSLLVDSSKWGNADIPVLIQLFHSVIEELNMLSGVSPNRQLLIQPDFGLGHPMCSRVGTYYMIVLSARQNFWSQYVYQFAHEYCHYLIDGPLDGELETTFWFEESICELASMFILNRTAQRWESWNLSFSGSPITEEHLALLKLKAFAPNNLVYLRDLLTKSDPIEMPLSDWIDKNIALLSVPEYRRDMYNQIATVLFGLFSDYPDLWKLIPTLSRPSKDEYLDFRSFITYDLPNRVQKPVEHLPQFIVLLVGK